MSYMIENKITFTTGLLLIVLPVSFALYANREVSDAIKFTAVVSLAFFYYWNFIWTDKKISEQRVAEIRKHNENKDKKHIENILSMAEAVNSFYSVDEKQHLRSNIFLKPNGEELYQIAAQYNMNTSKDLKIKIPLNKGATGEAWLTQTTIWADKKHIYNGEHRIPENERKKLPSNICWICSHPIIKNNETIAVINIDGDKEIEDPSLKENIENIVRLISKLLEDYDLTILKSGNN